MTGKHFRVFTSTLPAAVTRLSITDEKPFPFFQLPRELRDNIYGRLGFSISFYPQKRSSWSKESCHLRFEINNCWLAPPRLVNRQFKQEYEDEVTRSSDLAVHGDDAQISGMHNVIATFPAVLREVLPSVTVKADLRARDAKSNFAEGGFSHRILAIINIDVLP
jgi:hypothetical protein